MPWTITRRSFLYQAGLTAGSLILPGCQTNSDQALIRFGLVTDSHYAEREPNNTRYYRESLRKMEEFVQVMNREKVAFTMHLGDFKDEDPQRRPEDTLRYLQALESVYGQFAGPRYHCIGNHDVDSITKAQFLANIENTGISNTENFYAFQQNGVSFVVLDANFHADGRDHFYKEGADWEDTRIPPEQVKWLEKTLQTSSAPVVIFCHHPLYHFELHDAVFHIQNYAEIQSVITRSGKVVAVFQGHTHVEDYQQLGGVHYTTFLGMVDHSGPESNAFAIVEMYADGRFEIIGYRREKNKSWV